MSTEIETASEVQALITRPGFNIMTNEGKEELAELLYTAPQTDSPVIHRFGPGIYIREAHYQKGDLVIGHEHLQEHTNILLKGKIQVIDGDGLPQVLEAPYIFTAKAGRKLGLMLEDVIWQNIYATTETDIETLDNLLFKQTDSWIKYTEAKLKEATVNSQEDRDDFDLMLKQTGWTAEGIRACSDYNEDKIPFEYGSYAVVSGNSPIQGKGMFATAPFLTGMPVMSARINGKRTPGGYLVNHSKTPNVEAVINHNGDIYLIAIKTIYGMKGGLLGDEITLDYRQIMKLNNLWDGVDKCPQQ